jgi:hypothetical protein
MSWTPEDGFYPGYSILEDIGTSTEEEKQRVEKILQHDNIDLNDSKIKTYMELSRELMLFLSDECKEEIQEFSEYYRKEKYVGTTLPIELILSQIIISEIISLALSEFKDIFKNLIRKIKEYLKKRKDEKNIQEQTEIVLKIFKKIEKKGRIVENLEISMKKITNKD